MDSEHADHVIKVTDLIRQGLNTGAPLELAVAKAMMKVMPMKEDKDSEDEAEDD